MKEINEQNKEHILKGKKVVVKFGAPWCNPCKMYDQVLDILYSHEIYSCDVDMNTDWANKLSIRAVPTTILFDNGVEVRRLIGNQTKETVLKLFE